MRGKGKEKKRIEEKRRKWERRCKWLGRGRRKGGSVAGVARASADQYFISASPANPYLRAPRLLDSPIAACLILPSFSLCFPLRIFFPSSLTSLIDRFGSSALPFSPGSIQSRYKRRLLSGSLSTFLSSHFCDLSDNDNANVSRRSM